MRDVRLAPVYYPNSHAHRYAVSLIGLVHLFHARLAKKLEEAPAKHASDYLSAVASVFYTLPIAVFSAKEARIFVEALAQYHDRSYFAAFKKAIHVDIKPLLNQHVFDLTLEKAIQNNVALIQSIPSKLREQMEAVIRESVSKEGFNQGQLSEFLHQEINEGLKGRFLVAENRAKLIARDQTNKTIAAMSEARNRQIGITDYIWIGVDDERERPSHVANNGRRFSYDNPPETGNPGESYNCRCTAAPIVESETLHQLAFNPLEEVA